jgi:ankyrin repeat protein
MDDQAFNNLLGQARRGETAAVLAAVAGDQALLHRSDQYGIRLLHWACLGGDHLELVQCLVEAGSDLHAKDNNGWDALYSATVTNRLAVAAYLLDRGADPCTRSGYLTALGHAAYLGYQEMCVLLLSRGATCWP